MINNLLKTFFQYKNKAPQHAFQLIILILKLNAIFLVLHLHELVLWNDFS